MNRAAAQLARRAALAVLLICAVFVQLVHGGLLGASHVGLMDPAAMVLCGPPNGAPSPGETSDASDHCSWNCSGSASPWTRPTCSAAQSLAPGRPATELAWRLTSDRPEGFFRPGAHQARGPPAA